MILDNQISITNGPSKWNLLDAFGGSFEDVKDGGNRRSVRFTSSLVTVPGPTGLALIADVAINSLEHEDGSGHSWIFEGYLSSSSSLGLDLPQGHDRRVEGWYNTKTHKGYITLAK